MALDAMRCRGAGFLGEGPGGPVLPVQGVRGPERRGRSSWSSRSFSQKIGSRKEEGGSPKGGVPPVARLTRLRERRTRRTGQARSLPVGLIRGRGEHVYGP